MAVGSKKYSVSEISGHTSKDDCWLIIHGKVYDVTDFLEDHPGGDDVLLQAAANGDATQSFEDVGHSTAATNQMESFFMGVVDGIEAAVDAGGGDSNPAPASAGGNSNQAPAAGDPLLTKKPPAASPTSFMDVLLPLLILASAFAAWCYLKYYNNVQA
ncbi:Cytochrome b5 isoform A [Apostasia shenzhenica]|uniref:Cytochrome b5 isoform A n=1 Tax=Apostasia shenzhenica TaxID=1088818 RepID=A0A2I0BG00_9ASPA|nr:Cytochrome b5 isoform A [Apostasia shenzhenica]